MKDVTPDPDAPLDIEALPDFWDARRLRQGKADKSTCAAELRLALERGRCICGSTEKRCPVHGVIAVEEGVGTPNPFKRYYGRPSGVLKAGTHPLPYVRFGMHLRVVGRLDTFGCVVQDVYQNQDGWVAKLVAAYTGHSSVVSCDELRRCYELMSDFAVREAKCGAYLGDGRLKTPSSAMRICRVSQNLFGAASYLKPVRLMYAVWRFLKRRKREGSSSMSSPRSTQPSKGSSSLCAVIAIAT